MVFEDKTDIEDKLLGCIFIDEFWIEKTRNINIIPEMFLSLTNRALFKVILRLSDKNIGISPITVMEEAKKDINNTLKPSDVVSVVNSVSTSALIVEYANIIKEHYQRVSLWRLSEVVKELTANKNTNILEIVGDIEQSLYSLTSLKSNSSLEKIDKLLMNSYQLLEERCKSDNSVIGSVTGLNTLDRILGGFQKGKFYLISARPSMGKSCFAIETMEGLAKNGAKMAMFSLEMVVDELICRRLAANSGISLEYINNGKIKESQWGLMGDAVANIANMDIHIDDGGQDWATIKNKIRSQKRKYGLDGVVLDQISLVQGGKNETMYDKIGKISVESKQLAKELDIFIIWLSQLNRKVEDRPDKRPMLSDLAENGRLEQDIDASIMLWRPEYYGINGKKEGGNNIDFPENYLECIVNKNRGGRTGTIEMIARLDTQKILEVDRYAEY